MLNLDFLKQAAEKENILLNEDMCQKLDCYASLLVEWNEKINLTAITQPDEIIVKHFVDSLLLLKHLDLSKQISLIDVGTGAGFPSLPCKIAADNISLTMLDSLNKRINFLNEVIKQVDLSANCIHARAEEGGQKPELRERFDYATARAVAHLRELSEYCLPFVKVGGYFIALKGYEIEDELDEAKKAINILGGSVEDIMKYTLEDGSKRAIVKIKKISQTPTKYPRISGKIRKQPLQ